MAGWLAGWVVGGWVDGWVDAWMDGRTDGRRDGWMDGGMDGWKDTQTDVKIGGTRGQLASLQIKCLVLDLRTGNPGFLKPFHSLSSSSRKPFNL